MTNLVHRRARRRLTRLAGSDGERGSMAILLMVVLVGMVLSAMIVPVIITQDRTTKFDTTRVQALNAAESGIDVTLGLIRSSVSATTNIGDSKLLPCSPIDPTTGSPGVAASGMVNSASIARYSVVVEYFMIDPVAEVYPSRPYQQQYPNSSGNALMCSSGYGPYQSGAAGGPVTPKFARLTSTGTVGTAVNGSTAGRTLTTTYNLQTSDTNFSGGVIKIDPASASLCMDIGSATPAAGTVVMMQNCSTSNPPASRQVFSYRSDLTLELASTAPSNGVKGCDRTTPTNCGLCLNTSATPAAPGNAIQLSSCGPLGTPATYTQQWSYNDDGRYQASSSTSAQNGTLPDLCMTTAGQSAAVPVTLDTCGNSQRWIPNASIGAGAAALPQWINFNEFGRCLDVLSAIITNNLIDYPCKQNPYPGAVKWNQKFQAPPIQTGSSNVTGQIYTTIPDGTKYCLTSPNTDGGNVSMQVCDSTVSLQTWTIFGGDKSLTYSDKYKIVSGGSGAFCLGLAPLSASDVWSAINVEKCTGGTDQKWNANPSVLASTQKNLKEK